MQLIIDSTDEKIVQAIVEFIRPFNVSYRQVNDTDTVSSEVRERRVAIVRKFRGGLKKQFNGYQPSKTEWYEQ